MVLHLDERNGWPDELRFLLTQFPREVWSSHTNLGAMAQFWLERHAMFRELGNALRAATQEFRAGAIPAQKFEPWFGRQLQFFLSDIHFHHQIEDHHYFPVFKRAERHLLSGFETLERDHETIQPMIFATADAANTFLGNLHGTEDAMRASGDRYVETSETLLESVLRHLDDEEDLIIPLILDRGEHALGMYP